VNRGFRTEEGKEQDEPAEDPVAGGESHEEPSEFRAGGNPCEGNLRHRERHAEGERELGDLPRVHREASRREADQEARPDHRRKTSPGSEHASATPFSTKKVDDSLADEDDAEESESDRELLWPSEPLIHPESADKSR
jgi:hypothetical protein